MTAAGACRSCEEPVIWAEPADGGAPVLLDRDPNDAGLYAVMQDARLRTWVRVLAPGEQPRPGMERRHTRHFDTCTDRPPEVGGD